MRKPKLSQQVEEDLIAENERSRAEIDYLKNLNALSSKKVTATEKAQVISKLRHKHKLSLLFDVSGLLRAAYYYHTKHQIGTDKYEEIKRK